MGPPATAGNEQSSQKTTCPLAPKRASTALAEQPSSRGIGLASRPAAISWRKALATASQILLVLKTFIENRIH
jgi:hypothetical protein